MPRILPSRLTVVQHDFDAETPEETGHQSFFGPFWGEVPQIHKNVLPSISKQWGRDDPNRRIITSQEYR